MPEGRRAEELTLFLPHLPCAVMGEGKMPFPPPPLPAVAGGRASTGVMRMGELALSLTNCSTRERRPCTLLEKTVLARAQVSRVQMSLSCGTIREVAPLLASCCIKWASWCSAGELIQVSMKESWWVDELGYHPGLETGL